MPPVEKAPRLSVRGSSVGLGVPLRRLWLRLSSSNTSAAPAPASSKPPTTLGATMAARLLPEGCCCCCCCSEGRAIVKASICGPDRKRRRGAENDHGHAEGPSTLPKPVGLCMQGPYHVQQPATATPFNRVPGLSRAAPHTCLSTHTSAPIFATHSSLTYVSHTLVLLIWRMVYPAK